MKKSCVAIFASATVFFGIETSQADTIADWTFETSQPNATGTSAGPYSPEVGSGSASINGLGSATATINNVAGNGSTHSFSANNWTTSSYFQFEVSTLGYDDLLVSYDQTGSSTGPKNFTFEYSVNGGTFNVVSSSYTVQVNGSPNTAWSATGSRNSVYTFTDDLSANLDLDNATTVDFRILDASTISLGGNSGVVAAAGTDRVDNFSVTAAPVPEPSTLALGAVAGAIGWLKMRRKR